jgi:hypothetical protein
MRFAPDKNRLKATPLEKSSKIYWKNHQENYLRGTPSGWLTS